MAENEAMYTELQSKVQKMQSDLDEAHEKCIRMDLISSSLTTTQNKLQAVTNELNQIKNQNEELNKQLEEFQSRSINAVQQQVQGIAVDSTEQQPSSSRKRKYNHINIINV